MIAAAVTVARRLAGAIAPLLPWIAVAVLGAVAWHWTPFFGAGAQLARISADRDQWEASAGDWREAAEGWRASFTEAEQLRARETATAQAAAQTLIQQCSARVAEARASARVVERIVTREPTYDETRCPVRERVDPGLLRDALRPPAGTD